MRNITALLPCLLLATACGSTDAVPESPINESPVTPVGAGRTTAPPDSPAMPSAAPEFSIRGSVLTTLADNVHTSAVELVVVGKAGLPATNVQVEGRFTDGIKELAVLTTNANGIATATAASGQQHTRVGFTVLSATYLKDGARSAGKVIADAVYPSPCCPLKLPPTM